MAKVRLLSELSNIKDFSQFVRYCSQAVNDLVDQVNGGIDFGENISSQTVVASFASANTDVAIQHNLNKTGVLYFPVKKGSAFDIYDGVGSASLNQIFLRSNTAGVTVTLVLF